jgi:hypothetical protein
MSIVFKQLIPESAGTPPVSSSVATDAAGEQALMFGTTGDSPSATFTWSTPGGTGVSLQTGLNGSGGTVGLGYVYNMASGATTITGNESGGNFVGIQGIQYSGVASVVSQAISNIGTPPGTGTGAILGQSMTVNAGQILIACCSDVSGSPVQPQIITSPTGTSRGFNQFNPITAWTEYTGTGAAIQPSFTAPGGATDVYQVYQWLLSPTGGGGANVIPIRFFANGHMQANSFVQNASLLPANVKMRFYANGTVHTANIANNALGYIRLFANGTLSIATSSGGFIYKFNPGNYNSGSQYLPNISQMQADINNLSSNTTGIIGYVLGVRGSNLVKGSAYDNNVANAQGAIGNYSGFSMIGNTFNYLQNNCPGFHMGIFISDDVAWARAAPTGTLANTPVPTYVLNAPLGVLSLPTNFGDANTGNTAWTTYTMNVQNHAFGGGGQCGWGLSGWNGLASANASYFYLTPAFWDPCVNQYLILARQALAKYVLPPGSAYAGQTLDQCPLIEFIGSNDEVSYAYGSTAGDPYNPVGSAAPSNFHTQYFAMFTAWAAAFPHTIIPACVSFGFDSHSGSESSSVWYSTYLPALNAIPGVAITGADCVATAWVGGQGSGNIQSSWAQDAFIGITSPAQGPVLQTPTGNSLAGIMPYFAQIQPTDYGGTGHQANLLPNGVSEATSTLVECIAGAWGSANTAKIPATHRLWWNNDATFNVVFQTYIRPGITATSNLVSSVRPSNLP